VEPFQAAALHLQAALAAKPAPLEHVSPFGDATGCPVLMPRSFNALASPVRVAMPLDRRPSIGASCLDAFIPARIAELYAFDLGSLEGFSGALRDPLPFVFTDRD
jgi:hypothetical protein